MHVLYFLIKNEKKSLAVELTIKRPPKILDGLEFIYQENFLVTENVDEEIYKFLYPVKILSENLIIEGVSDNNLCLLDPVYLKYKDGKRKLLFDHLIHGYNGVFEITASEVGKNAILIEFTCPECNNKSFDLNLILIYELWDDEVLEDDELMENISDIFTSFILDGVCENCDWHGNICSIECA